MKSVHQVLVLFLLSIVSTNTFAGLVFYTDKAAFESDLVSYSTVVVDDFSSLTYHGPQSYKSDVTEYSGTGGLFGCTDDSDVIGNTGCNYGSNFDYDSNEWVYLYGNTATFTMSNNVNAFGFEFDSPYSNHEVLMLNINGVMSEDLSTGFFGVLSDDKSSIGSTFDIMWEVTTDLFLPGALGVDNITTSFISAEEVPEPTTVLLFGLALAAIATRRTKHI